MLSLGFLKIDKILEGALKFQQSFLLGALIPEVKIPSPTHNIISVETEALIQFLIQNINGFFVRILKEQKKEKDRRFFCFVQF
jgi:hypothetical protein